MGDGAACLQKHFHDLICIIAIAFNPQEQSELLVAQCAVLGYGEHCWLSCWGCSSAGTRCLQVWCVELLLRALSLYWRQEKLLVQSLPSNLNLLLDAEDGEQRGRAASCGAAPQEPPLRTCTALLHPAGCHGHTEVIPESSEPPISTRIRHLRQQERFPR